MIQPLIRTPAEAVAYFQSNYYPRASAAEIAKIAALYPDDPAAGIAFVPTWIVLTTVLSGSPFNTSDLNQLT